MTKRRRIALMTVACLALAVGLAAWLQFLNARPVRLANHRDMQPGMTLAEAEKILGGPPGDYSSAPGQTHFRLNVRVNGQSETWISDDGIIIVGFDEEGRVNGWSFAGPGVIPPRLIDRLRAWIGL
jgi:hypothetical protein